MKKLFICIVSAALIVAGSVFLHSCEQSSLFDNTHEVFLDLNVSNMENLTSSQLLIFEEAKSRIDRHVTFDGKQYQLSIRSGREVNISESLFQHFGSVMNETNTMLKDMIVIPCAVDSRILYLFDESQPIQMNARLRSGVEAPPSGGVTTFTVHWWGYNLYLSRTTLLYLGYGGCAIGIIYGIIPEPTMITKVVAVVTGLAGLYMLYLADTNPNGVIIPVPIIAPAIGIFFPSSQ